MSRIEIDGTERAGFAVGGGAGNRGALRTAGVSAALRLLAMTTPWVEPELLGLRRLVRPGDVCIDVGAALGIYTAVLADLVGRQGIVHSVEPLRFAHPVIGALLRPRVGANVRRHAVALGAQRGGSVMNVPMRSGHLITGRSFVAAGSDGLGSNVEFDRHVQVQVPTETLDDFCAEHGVDRLDFVKADVEGGELRLLHGGARTIKRCRPTLLLELEDRHTARFGYPASAAVDWLAEHGYRMSLWRNGSWQPVDRITPQYRNYLFRT
ncbi:MAG: FkbM family methyltransferase [Sciscionella sp.]|nr:FkbM family methyltransferase [Sciscionella sp.]